MREPVDVGAWYVKIILLLKVQRTTLFSTR